MPDDHFRLIAIHFHSGAPSARAAGRAAPSGEKSSDGFTIVELLVVVGIISVLIALLLPALTRAQEQARQIKCLGNLQQLGEAFVMYANNNRLRLPAGAPLSALSYNDWIFWEASVPRLLNDSALAPYLGPPANPQLFICPSDDITYRARTGAYNGYRYSYSMVDQMSQYNLAQIRSPWQKVLLYEEDQSTIDDGFGTPEAGLYINLLAIRHDSTRQNPDGPTTGLSLNGNCRGNVLFCDGHGEYTTRNIVHSQPSWDPLY